MFMICITDVPFSEGRNILIVFLAFVGYLSGNDHDWCCIPWGRHFFSSCIFLSYCDGALPACCRHPWKYCHVLGIHQLLVIVICFIVYLADVHKLEVIKKILPKDKEYSVVLLGIPKAFLVSIWNLAPKLFVTVWSTSAPLHLSPRIPNFQ